MKRLLLLIVGLLLTVHFSAAQMVIRIGVLGDSNSDEYRADDNRAGGTPYAATTLNWLELAQRYRGVDVGTWGSRSEPRRAGYAYNWARSAATAGSMVSSGQHTGLANQISAGQVDYAVIFVGINDFHIWNGTYAAVYNCPTPCAATQTKIDAIVANLTTAVDTLLAANPDGVLLVNYFDPDFVAEFPDASKRARVTAAIEEINTRLDTLAASRGIVLADIAAHTADVMTLIDASGNLIIGGESISVMVQGNEPHHLRLGDSVGHPGTVGNGLLANYLMGELADGYDLPFTPFSDVEILANAGILPAQPTATPTVTPVPTLTPTPTATPQSSAFTLQISGGGNDVNEVNNALTANGNPMWIGNGGTTATSFTGLRFTGVTIPQGATITAAHIEVRSAQSQWINLSLQFRGEATNNSAAFSAGNRPSQRPLTAAQIIHTSNTNWSSGQWVALNDIKTVIQEIVNRPGWVSGNALSLIVKGTGGNWSRKFLTSYEGNAAQSIRLVVTVSS